MLADCCHFDFLRISNRSSSITKPQLKVSENGVELIYRLRRLYRFDRIPVRFKTCPTCIQSPEPHFFFPQRKPNSREIPNSKSRNIHLPFYASLSIMVKPESLPSHEKGKKYPSSSSIAYHPNLASENVCTRESKKSREKKKPNRLGVSVSRQY
jgi:hypothetical protein